MQEKIKYSDIMDLGFTEQIEQDPVYFAEFGFNWAIITLDLTKKIYLDWEKETQLCQMIRIDSPKTCNILARMPIKNLEHLKGIVKFYKK